jgi:hypothetical protein
LHKLASTPAYYFSPLFMPTIPHFALGLHRYCTPLAPPQKDGAR